MSNSYQNRQGGYQQGNRGGGYNSGNPRHNQGYGQGGGYYHGPGGGNPQRGFYNHPGGFDDFQDRRGPPPHGGPNIPHSHQETRPVYDKFGYPINSQGESGGNQRNERDFGGPRDPREQRDLRDPRDHRDQRDQRDHRDHRDHRDQRDQGGDMRKRNDNRFKDSSNAGYRDRGGPRFQNARGDSGGGPRPQSGGQGGNYNRQSNFSQGRPSQPFQQQSKPAPSSNQIAKNVYNPHGFDDDLLELFKPNPPLPVLPPLEKYSDEILDHDAPAPVSDFLKVFDERRNELECKRDGFAPPKFKFQVEAEKRDRKMFQREKDLRENMFHWLQNLHVPLPNKTREPFHTLFVSGIGYDVTEDRLKTEFEIYGPINRAVIVRDMEGKSRGYGFIEYMNKDDMIKAFEYGYNKLIDGRRLIIDVERGRTVEGWCPRKLGGGMGISRPPQLKLSARVMTYRGRGGFRGGGGRSPPPSKRRRF